MRRHPIAPIRQFRYGGMLPVLHYKNGKYLSQHHLRLAKEQGSAQHVHRTSHSLITKGSGVMMDDSLPKPPRKMIRPLKFKY